MSDQPDATAPDATAPEPSPRRFGRGLWSWVRRRPVVVAITACVLEAAAVAGTGLATMPSAPPGPHYASLPAQPCAMVSSAGLARYLPGATGSPQSVMGVSQVKIGACKWLARSGGQDTTLIAQAIILGSPSGVSDAQESYRATLTRLTCRCPGVTVHARPVAGLGDRAAEVFVAPQPYADFASAPNATNPGTTLLVQSSNALILLGLDTTATRTGAFLATPPSAAQLTGLMSMARDVIGVLAHPASIPRSAIAPVTPEARYPGRRDPCKLIGAATLARYAPSAILSPDPAPSYGATQDSECDWNSDSASITVKLRIYPGPASALRDFDTDAESAGVTPAGARWIPDLAEAAAATYTIDTGSDIADLFLWSGNAYLDYTYKSSGSGRSRPDRSAPLAGVIAMARDGLAALARPSVSVYPQGPRYASPRNTCTMIKASTLVRYTPGATVDQVPGNGAASETGNTNCGLNSDSVSIFLNITIDSDGDNAQSDFEFSVQDARKSHGDTKFKGMRTVRGVGEQATAIFQTFRGSPSVDLLVWSGNAEVEVSCTDLGFAPPLSPAGKLAADIAMARDVLADLPRA